MAKSNKIKILTLTTQYANNMGALLQCYALSKFLNGQKNVECEVLQYLPVGHNRSWTIFHKPRTLRDVAKLAYQIVCVKDLLRIRKKQAKVRKFIEKYIPLTKRKYSRKDIISNPPEADAFIVGSDQIWNFNYRCDLTYFLDFTKNNPRKISYAASIADDWTEAQSETIAPYIRDFDCVSIREKGNLHCVNSVLVDEKATVVCDPVFLLRKEDWDDIKVNPHIEEPYIFCYFLSVSQMAVEAVKKLRQLTGFKVVHLNLNALDKFNSDIVIKDADPAEFVGLISNASYVCTNSFHCSAFSIIYRRNFKFVPKHIANERLVQLEDIFGIDVILNQEKLNTLSVEQLKTDYSKVAQGDAFIDYSKDFLLNSIYADRKD
ncbi:MAG: polysaccharide pyruvyl transferase family protein [Bacteroidales bacterium]|nr:polysaccharide pyruvyl transferase family protein [Bacteroidales bacterium]